MTRTIQQLAQQALDVQDACNLSGVVHGFSRAITELRELFPDKGTDWFNEHPICALWADKIAHLTRTQTIANDKVFHSYRAVQEIVEGKEGF